MGAVTTVESYSESINGITLTLQVLLYQHQVPLNYTHSHVINHITNLQRLSNWTHGLGELFWLRSLDQIIHYQLRRVLLKKCGHYNIYNTHDWRSGATF